MANDVRVIAIDTALLLPESANERAKSLNKGFWGADKTGFLFDSTHLPHITLFQQFVRPDDLPRINNELGIILNGMPSFILRATQIIKPSTTTHLIIEPNAVLQGLHERVCSGLKKFSQSLEDESAFYREREVPRKNDIEWVKGYASKASFQNFNPHVTLGIGKPFELDAPIEFTASRIAVCQLGR
ncbi:2'-5' RNA ligase family protein, partial [Elusimicrobiota bacterium]